MGAHFASQQTSAAPHRNAITGLPCLWLCAVCWPGNKYKKCASGDDRHAAGDWLNMEQFDDDETSPDGKSAVCRQCAADQMDYDSATAPSTPRTYLHRDAKAAGSIAFVDTEVSSDEYEM